MLKGVHCWHWLHWALFTLNIVHIKHCSHWTLFTLNIVHIKHCSHWTLFKNPSTNWFVQNVSYSRCRDPTRGDRQMWPMYYYATSQARNLRNHMKRDQVPLVVVSPASENPSFRCKMEKLTSEFVEIMIAAS